MQACTIAGIAMKIFRYMFLPKNTLAIVPEFGYERNDRASDIAIKYLEWKSRQEGIKIQHAGNGREMEFLTINPENGRMKRLKVDGYVVSEDRAIEFLGCHFHGCPTHTVSDYVGPNGKLNRINFNETMDRLKLLENLCGKVEFVWECTIREQVGMSCNFFLMCNLVTER